MVIEYAHVRGAEIWNVFNQVGAKLSEIWASVGHVSTFLGRICCFLIVEVPLKNSKHDLLCVISSLQRFRNCTRQLHEHPSFTR